MKRVMLCTASAALIVLSMMFVTSRTAPASPIPVAAPMVAMPVQASGSSDALPFDPNTSCPDSGILPDPPYCGSCAENGKTVSAEDARSCGDAYTHTLDEICATARKNYDKRMKQHDARVQSYTSEAIACLAHATTPAAQQACIDTHQSEMDAENASYVVDMIGIHNEAAQEMSIAKTEYSECMRSKCHFCQN